MRQRAALWVVLAGMVVGFVGVAALAVTGVGGASKPSRLPALALGGGEKLAAAGATADALMPVRPVEYRVAGQLPKLDDAANVWSIGNDVERAAFDRLVSALGFDGAKVEATADAWVARTATRELRVDRATPGAPWYVNNASSCPDAPVSSDPNVRVECLVASSGVASSGVASSGMGSSGSGTATAVAPVPPDTTTSTVEPCPMPECPPGAACAQVCPQPEPVPVPVPEPQRPADLPTKAEAERIARDVLGKAGVDLDGAAVRVDDGFSQWIVSVDPQVGGRPTMGFASGVGVGPKGEIEFANGWLGDPTEGDEYPLAGVDAAIQRLHDAPFGWSPYPGAPMPAIARDTTELTAPTETIPTQVRTITGVRLGLMFAPLADGRDALLVPAYFFTVDDSEFPQPVIAVADEYLPKPAPAPQPGEPEPAPMPVEPGGGPGTSPSGACAGETAGALELQLCGPAEAKVGEDVAFTFTVSSATGGFIEQSCAGPTVLFGDEAGPRAACDIACAATRSEPRKFGQTFTHHYEKPGTYRARGWVRMCDGNTDHEGPALEVTVRG